VGIVGKHVLELAKQKDESGETQLVCRKLIPINQQFVGQSASSLNEEAEIEGSIRDYFHIDTMDIDELHAHFAKVDPNLFGRVVSYYNGWRLVKMEPLETLFSFICSSNNNVSRITTMVQSLCEGYGTKLGDYTIDDGANTFSMYAFPTLAQLEQCNSKDLR